MSEQNPGRVRVSDAEREQVVSVLRDAMGEGRLTMAEGEERIAAAYATTFRDELPRLTADLPPPEPAAGRAGSWSGRPGRPGPRTEDRQSGRRGQPGAAAPAVGLAALGAVVAGVWALVTSGTLWPAILLGILAVMLAKHAGRGQWHGCGGRPADRRSAG